MLIKTEPDNLYERSEQNFFSLFLWHSTALKNYGIDLTSLAEPVVKFKSRLIPVRRQRSIKYFACLRRFFLENILVDEIEATTIVSVENHRQLYVNCILIF